MVPDLVGRRLKALFCGVAVVLGGLGTSGITEAGIGASSVRAVSVSPDEESVTVRVMVAGPMPRYRVQVLASPVRLVLDLERTVFAWRSSPLRSSSKPVAEVRGSQWSQEIARVVVQLSERMPYRVEREPGSLVVVIARSSAPPQAGSDAPGPPDDGSAHRARQERVLDAGETDGVAASGGQRDSDAPFETQFADALASAAPARESRPANWSIRGHVEAGGRFYLNHRGEGLPDESVTLEGLVDLRYRLADETELRLRPRLALDPLITTRNRYEPLDAYVEHATPRWSLLAGQAVENWAVVDTFNPVDVLNRRDLERDFYDPERLGEVMFRFRSFLPDAGPIQQPVLSLYFLPLHRETPLPSNRDRFRFDATGDGRGDLRDDAIVASPSVAYAARLSATVGQADVFLVYFGGPSRIPSLALSPAGEITPVYYLVDMVGAGLQWAIGPWVVKLEAAQTFTKSDGLPPRVRGAVPRDFFQYVVGIDRTFTDVLGKNEVTVTLEYAGEDHPGETDLTGLRPYKSDVFLGVRWSFNDPRRTHLQASVAADVRVAEQLWLVNFTTTLYRNLRLVVDGQFVNRAPRNGLDRLTTFNVFPNNSNVRLALRYDF